MNSRRTISLLVIALLALIVWVFRLPKSASVPSEISNEGAVVTSAGPAPAAANPGITRRVAPTNSRTFTEAELELKRLEDEFFKQFPLAAKFREYGNQDYRSPQRGALGEVIKNYMDEPGDVRTKNLRSNNLNIILELEAPLLMKEMLVSDSELGQMIRVAFHSPRWGWGHMLRNLDSRIGNPASPEPIIDSAEQLVAALQEREERILNYARKMKEEASMPDHLFEDIEKFVLELLTGSVVTTYLETVTSTELKEARKRVAREAQERMPQ